MSLQIYHETVSPELIDIFTLNPQVIHVKIVPSQVVVVETYKYNRKSDDFMYGLLLLNVMESIGYSGEIRINIFDRTKDFEVLKVAIEALNRLGMGKASVLIKSDIIEVLVGDAVIFSSSFIDTYI